MEFLERDPYVSIVVAEDSLPYRGIEVRGEAKRVSSQLIIRLTIDRWTNSRLSSRIASTTARLA
jgi:hypothetical protein